MNRLILAALLLASLPYQSYADSATAEAAFRRSDHAAAYEACKKDAEQGDADCQNLVGVLFRQGLGVPQNTTEAIRLFRLAAAKKLPAAQNNLGLAYLNGTGVPQDNTQAAQWFALSAEQADPIGQTQLAVLMLGGKGVEKDSEKAVGMLRQSANRGFVPAQLLYALIYEKSSGKWYHPEIAYTWYRIAARTTKDPIQKARATEGVNRTIGLLSSQEIVTAQTTEAYWKPSGPGLEFGLLGARPATASAPGAPKADRIGSGLVVSHTGDVVTNNHVIDGCAEITVLRDGKPVAAKMIATDPGGDLALIRIEGPVEAIARFRQTGAARPGEAVVVTGYPLQGLLTSDASVTTGIVSALAGVHNDKKQLQISAPVQPGNSGGPLIGADGAVIGVVVGKLNGLKVAQATGAIPENINFAVHVELVRELLDKNSVKYETITGSETLATPTIAEQALKYTVMVKCGK